MLAKEFKAKSVLLNSSGVSTCIGSQRLPPTNSGFGIESDISGFASNLLGTISCILFGTLFIKALYQVIAASLFAIFFVLVFFLIFLTVFRFTIGVSSSTAFGTFSRVTGAGKAQLSDLTTFSVLLVWLPSYS